MRYLTVCMGILTLQNWMPDSGGFGRESDSDGFGRIQTDSRTPNMEVTNPGPQASGLCTARVDLTRDLTRVLTRDPTS